MRIILQQGSLFITSPGAGLQLRSSPKISTTDNPLQTKHKSICVQSNFWSYVYKTFLIYKFQQADFSCFYSSFCVWDMPSGEVLNGKVSALFECGHPAPCPLHPTSTWCYSCGKYSQAFHICCCFSVFYCEQKYLGVGEALERSYSAPTQWYMSGLFWACLVRAL